MLKGLSIIISFQHMAGHHAWKYHAKAYIPYMGSDIALVVSYGSGYHNRPMALSGYKWYGCYDELTLRVVSYALIPNGVNADV